MTERVVACVPPVRAVMVGNHKVDIEPPDMLGVLSRVDLIVEETRSDLAAPRLRALQGVPTLQPSPPAPLWNLSVQQRPLAYVYVPRGQAAVVNSDIEQVEGWLPPVVD